MLVSIGWVVLGLALTLAGAEAFVRAAAAIASRFGISPLVIGLTVVAWGTSAPELVVSSLAALNGQGGIAAGNVVGSNIFNIAAIVGLSAIICPLRVHAQVIRMDIPIMIVVCVLMAALLFDRAITRIDAAVLLSGMVAYTVFTFRAAGNEPPSPAQDQFSSVVPAKRRHVSVDVALFIVGLVLLVLGSRALVTGAVSMARLLNVSETIIGLTIVAAGTSLPELATSLVAAWRGQTDIAVGNVVGSNIFNVLGILGLTGAVAPFGAPDLMMIDLAMMLGTAIVFFPLARSGFVVNRWEGAVLLGAFLVYITWQWSAAR